MNGTQDGRDVGGVAQQQRFSTLLRPSSGGQLSKMRSTWQGNPNWSENSCLSLTQLSFLQKALESKVRFTNSLGVLSCFSGGPGVPRVPHLLSEILCWHFLPAVTKCWKRVEKNFRTLISRTFYIQCSIESFAFTAEGSLQRNTFSRSSSWSGNILTV